MIDVLRNNYMIYAKSTITDRAFPFIDGYKPVQRRVLYSMHQLGLEKKSAKSARVVGECMGVLHPHGDSSIYGAMCTMADNTDGRNAAEVHAIGCFGKTWSTITIPPAHMRYTEAKLSQIASNCSFNGLNEDAVDFIDNFDNTAKEPVLLPVMYPNIIVNTSSGLACGLKTYIPCYALKNACEATIALLKGKISSEQDLVDILDAPDFQTGGIVNMTNAQKIELVRYGATKGIYITSRYKFDPKTNQMTIYEIPYNTTCEKITSQIENCIKERKIQGISRVVNGADKNGLGIVVFLQNNFKAENVFKFLCAYTDVQTRISFQTKFVNIDEKGEMMYKEVGILELLNEYWIPWRISVLRRIAQHKFNKIDNDKHRLEGFTVVGDRMPEYVKIVMDNNRAEAKEKHFKIFGLDDVQEEYLLGCSIDSLTLDGVLRAKEKIAKLAEEAKALSDYIADDVAIKKQMIEELTEISKKYSITRKSSSENESTLVQLTKEEATAISSDRVWVGFTERGRVKKALTKTDYNHFADRVDGKDRLLTTFEINNNEKALVYTTAGFVYKMPVNQLDSSSRTTFKESAWRFITKDKADMHKELVRKSDVFYATASGDTPGGCNLIYKNGFIKCIRYDMYNTSRKVYKNAFPEFDPDNGFIVPYDGIVFITSEGRALIKDFSYLRTEGYDTKGKTLVRLPKMHENETIYKVYPLEDLKLVASEELIEHFSKKSWLMADRGKYKLTGLIVKAENEKSKLNKVLEVAEEEATELLNESVEHVNRDIEQSGEDVHSYKEADFFDADEDDA